MCFTGQVENDVAWQELSLARDVLKMPEQILVIRRNSITLVSNLPPGMSECKAFGDLAFVPRFEKTEVLETLVL